MKGFIICEDYRGKKVVEAVKLGAVNYTTSSSDGDWVSELSGIRKGATQAYCNKDDTYDFEVGALIALMKMCGVEKVVRACNEAFSEDTFKTYALKYERELNELKKYSDKVIDKLIEENEKLKLDCEKLQHGYIDTDMIFCGGRQNGKQYTFLVDLFKKLDQKKVDAAYKEAYLNWCLRWTKSTKREEMWTEIFAIHKKDDVIIKVKREDINSFFHEIENKNPEITWASSVKIFEAKGTIGDIYDGLKIRDTVYFRLSKDTKLSYSSDPDVYRYKDLHHIDYLPPMRWDLFKKGRRIIRVTPDKLDEFMKKCSIKLGAIMKPNLKRYKDSTHAFIMISDYHYDNKPTIHIMSPEDLVRNQHENPKKYSDKKIVDWEDVR